MRDLTEQEKTALESMGRAYSEDYVLRYLQEKALWMGLLVNRYPRKTDRTQLATQLCQLLVAVHQAAGVLDPKVVDVFLKEAVAESVKAAARAKTAQPK